MLQGFPGCYVALMKSRTMVNSGGVEHAVSLGKMYYIKKIYKQNLNKKTGSTPSVVFMNEIGSKLYSKILT